MRKYLVLIVALLLMSAGALFAGTTATNTNVVQPTLVINATVQQAVELTLKTGTLAGINHCTIATGGGGDYNMNFGTVDGLGLNPGNCNVFAPATLGQTAAVYYTDYQLTPAWAGMTATNAASITAFAAAPAAGVDVQVPSTSTDQSTTAGLSVSTWNTLGATSGTATPVVSGTGLAGDGTGVTRFMALSVSPTAAAALGGTGVNTTVTFTMTIK